MGGLKLNYNGGPFSKMVWFLKIKFLIILKLNFNGGQFYKKYKILVITKNCKFFSYIKFEIENGEDLR